jgi:hypothetical protein
LIEKSDFIENEENDEIVSLRDVKDEEDPSPKKVEPSSNEVFSSMVNL